MGKVDIFDIVKPYDNDLIGSMDKEYREDYLKYLNQYMLGLRESLDLPKNVTFGLEIETEYVNSNSYRDLRNDLQFINWNFVGDGSLCAGREVVSPILYDNLEVWLSLYRLLDNLSKMSRIDVNSGGHIHFGAQIIGNDLKDYLNLLKLWAAYENIIFRFGYGEFVSERTHMYCFACPILLLVKDAIEGERDWENFFFWRGNALSFCNLDINSIEKYNKSIEGFTLEVRNPNSSLNPIIWQNNFNFFAKLLLYAKEEKFDEQLIEKRIMELSSTVSNYKNEIDYYKLIDLEGAIELADLIFDKSIDKVYFLRQYIKNYEIGNVVLQKGKKFTKNPNY